MKETNIKSEIRDNRSLSEIRDWIYKKSEIKPSKTRYWGKCFSITAGALLLRNFMSSSVNGGGTADIFGDKRRLKINKNWKINTNYKF